MTDTAPDSYSRAQKGLHWAIVALLAVQYLFFDNMGRLFDRSVDTGTLQWTTTSVAHALIGTTVLALVAWRLALRLNRGTPPPHADEPELAQKAAYVTHITFYCLLIGLPLGGLGAWFLGNETLAQVHEVGTTILLWVIGLHVAAVLVHQFYWKTAILNRMT